MTPRKTIRDAGAFVTSLKSPHRVAQQPRGPLFTHLYLLPLPLRLFTTSRSLHRLKGLFVARVIDETISINKMRHVNGHGLSFRGVGGAEARGAGAVPRSGTFSEFAEKYARTQG